MSENKEFTDIEISEINNKRNSDYIRQQIRIMLKVMVYTSFFIILITLISIVLISYGVV